MPARQGRTQKTAARRKVRPTPLLDAQKEEDSAGAQRCQDPRPLIHTLPVELLSLIFCIVADASYGAATYLRPRELYDEDSKWLGLPIIGVCRRWRAVALDSPAFWSKVPLTSLKWTKVALKRSKHASIVIDNRDMRLKIFPQPLEVEAEALRLALLHTSRARQICFAMREEAMPATAWSVLCQEAAPRLELLYFDNYYGGLNEPADELFGRHSLPALRDVNIKRLCVKCTSPILQAPLVLLSITDCGPVWESITAMVETLSRMPYLQELTIEDSLPPAPEFPRRRHPAQVPLCRLGSITLVGSCTEVAAAIQSMALRSTCSPSLTVTIGHDEPIDALAILKAELSALLCPGGASGGSFDILTLRDTGNGNYQALRFTASLSSVTKHGSFPKELALVIHWAENTTFTTRIAQLQASQCPVPHISRATTFSATPNILPWRKTLTSLLSELSNVTYLHITDSHGFRDDVVLPAIPHAPNASDLDGETPEPIPALGRLFPRCRNIYLHYIDFDEIIYAGNTSFMDVLVEEFTQVEGGPRRDKCSIRIVDCTLSEDALDEVQTMFGKVNWDGALDGLCEFRRKVQERIARSEQSGLLLDD